MAAGVVLDELERAIRTRDAGVPGRVLMRLVALHDSLDSPQNTLQDIDFDGFFVKLLTACDRGTRMRLAQHWCGQKNPPRQAMLLLALDRDPAIATFVINSAKSLTNNDLLEIAQRGTSTQWHALADRPALSAILVDFLMVFADEETRNRIKSNPFAHWSDPADSLFNRPNRPSIRETMPPIPETIDGIYPETIPQKTLFRDKTPYSETSAPDSAGPRRAALELATRLALHMLDRPSPQPALLAALLTKDLARGHHARLLARLALAANISAEAVMRGFSANDSRAFATILWALGVPQILFERLMALKNEAFPQRGSQQAETSSEPQYPPLTAEQARQALQFLTRADQKTAAKQTTAVWP